jgi:transcriptional antiterminator
MSIQNKDTQEKVLLDYMLIKYYAKRANLTINQLSEKLGVTRQTIRSWTKKPTLIINMWMLEDILEVKSGDLIVDGL